jgi:RhoGEF domain
MLTILWKAATFNAYGVFCAEHPGAIEIVKYLQRKRPLEWDAFERRCTALVAASLAHVDGLPERRNSEEEEASSKDQYPDADSDGKDPELSHVQQQPTTSLDNYSSWRSRSNHDLKRAVFTIGKDTKKENLVERDPRLRMQFTDYLIKPVQRICRYHLLLAPLTLERGPKVPTGADAVVMGARQAMADVAALVDNANFSHLQQQQTSRISARLSAPVTVLAFIRTLSPCTLAGSLDVVRAPVLKAKYLAAFLYEGGFLAFAKVTRGPRYELRYWFSLEGFELCDATDDDRELQPPRGARMC